MFKLCKYTALLRYQLGPISEPFNTGKTPNKHFTMTCVCKLKVFTLAKMICKYGAFVSMGLFKVYANPTTGVIQD